jgi:hypothetical protein
MWASGTRAKSVKTDLAGSVRDPDFATNRVQPSAIKDWPFFVKTLGVQF